MDAFQRYNILTFQQLEIGRETAGILDFVYVDRNASSNSFYVPSVVPHVIPWWRVVKGTDLIHVAGADIEASVIETVLLWRVDTQGRRRL